MIFFTEIWIPFAYFYYWFLSSVIADEHNAASQMVTVSLATFLASLSCAFLMVSLVCFPAGLSDVLSNYFAIVIPHHTCALVISFSVRWIITNNYTLFIVYQICLNMHSWNYLILMHKTVPILYIYQISKKPHRGILKDLLASSE